ECLEGTRQDILARIDAWIMEIDAPNVLWINGYPGVGKSAIATSIVEKWRSSGRLGSSFFFRREAAEAMTPHALWRTVAYDLARRYPSIRKHLVAMLAEDDTRATTSNVDKLFRELIHNPLVATNDISTKSPPIIVIDALDECGGLDGRYSDHRKGLMRTIKSWSGLPCVFRLVVTSRRESDIEQMFLATPHRSLSITAGQSASYQSSEDIRAFLRHELRQIASQYPLMSPDWPGEKVIQDLTKLASGLFIWVVTALKLLERGEPERTLKQIMGRVGGIASLYKCILDTSFPSPSNEDIDDFRSVLGAIILAKTPLDVVSLADLLSVSTSAIGHICNGLHSVLTIGDTLRIHHQSFVDFLLNPDECPTPFLVDRQRENWTLTMACLRTMKNNLRFNICDLETSYIHNQDIPDLDLRVKARIPPLLSYSSCHWAGHLIEGGFSEEIYESLQYFMSNLFLFWLEVLSLIKRVNIGSSIMRLLITWLKEFGRDETLAMDMQKFIVAFASVISQSTPHIYVSALPFAPRDLAVSRKYIGCHPQTLTVRRGGYTGWPAIQIVLSGHTSWVNSVSFSPGGTRIASGSSDRTIRVWDAETGENVIGPLEGHSDSVNSVSFSPDGTRIVSGSSDNTIRIWDVERGVTVIGPLEGHTGWVRSVSFSPDGTRIASGSSDNTIRVWDIENSETVLGPLKGHIYSITSVSFSPDGTYIVSGSEDETIRVWDSKTGEKVVGPLEGHTDYVNSISFSPDGTRIVSGSSDNSIRIWGIKTGNTMMGPLKGHTDSVMSVSFSPDGTRIVSGSSDTTIRVWDSETGETVIGPLEGHAYLVNSVSFSPDGTRFASGSEDSTVQVWSAEVNEKVMSLSEGHTNSVSSVSFSPDGTRIASGSYDKTTRVWDAGTGETVIGPLEGHTDSVLSVSFSADGTRLASGSSDNSIRVWDIDTGETVIELLEGHVNSIMSVSFSPDGRRIISGSQDNFVQTWDVETSDIVEMPLERYEYVLCLAFSPLGTRVASGFYNNTIKIRGTKTDETGEMVIRSGEREDSIYSLSFSLDSTRIASGSSDKTIRVWDTETGETVTKPFKGHSDWVSSVSFSPDGTRIASGSYDKTIRVWNVETGETVMGPLEGHTDRITSVSFSLDGTRLVSGSNDMTVRVWNLDAGCSTVRSFHSLYDDTIAHAYS
ncbi:hypothetical protein M408DRAFT_83185, partial [Serendipita vermifera MAFF 305830]